MYYKSLHHSSNFTLPLHTPSVDNDTHIPGLGAKCATAFLKHEINSVYMVVGKFLMFRDANSSSDSACQAFFNWLGECELPATGTCKHSITRALAEKLNLMIPGFYDNSVYSVLGTR